MAENDSEMDHMGRVGLTVNSGRIFATPSNESRNSIGDGKSHSIESETASVDRAWTENTDVPKRRMGLVQVTALMINQMIGTGIFSTPGAILFLTGSKPVSLVLWAVGGIYTFLSALMYLEYGTALPFTGGPLIWLDEAFHWPAMLAAIIFSWYWVIFAVSANCTTVAVYLIALAYPSLTFSELPKGWVKFVACVVQIVACIVLYFGRRICFMFNGLFAAYKVVFLLVFFAAGMAASRRADSGLSDWNTTHPGGGGINTLSAMIYIVYSYQGWEHTNYIAGEIREPRRFLKLGVFLSVSIVTCLYMLVSIAFYIALPYATIEGGSTIAQQDISFLFAQKVFGGTTAIKACIALSAWSQVVAYTYTSAKVKQAIAWQRILPFYKFFGRQDRQFDSPGGALFLQGLVNVITMSIFTEDGSVGNFWGNIYTYMYQLEIVFLGLGLLRLSRRMQVLDKRWRPTYLRPNYVLWTFCFILVGFNIIIAVTTALPVVTGNVPSYYWPIAASAMFVAATAHWAILHGLQRKRGNGPSLGEKIGFEVKILSYDSTEDNRESLDSHTQLMKEALADGSRRRIEYKDNWDFLFKEFVADFALWQTSWSRQGKRTQAQMAS